MRCLRTWRRNKFLCHKNWFKLINYLHACLRIVHGLQLSFQVVLCNLQPAFTDFLKVFLLQKSLKLERLVAKRGFGAQPVSCPSLLNKKKAQEERTVVVVLPGQITFNEHVINGNRLDSSKANNNSNWFAFPLFFRFPLSSVSIDYLLCVYRSACVCLH